MIRSCTLMLAGLGCAPVAQSHPEKPMRVTIAASPGEGCDARSRLVAQEVAENPCGERAGDIGFEPR